MIDNTLPNTSVVAPLASDKYPTPKPYCDEAEFLRTVANHQMKVLQDQMPYRHLQFRAPKTSIAWFEIVTWPGRLCITGDMGTFVFTGSVNMFNFFRDETHRPSGKLKVNFDYWRGKCLSADGDGDGIKRYDADLFRANVARLMDESEVSPATRAEIEREVIGKADEGEHEAIRAGMEFKARDGFQFHDFWEYSHRMYSYRYLWACYAIAWAIQSYDALRATPAQFAEGGTE